MTDTDVSSAALSDLKLRVADGSIDTVVAAIPDMQGRLMGKRFHASHFIDSAWEETHCCNYLVATDIEMAPVPGYRESSWATGYGDYVMRPDLTTLRYVPWLERTAYVLCDLFDHHGHEPVPHAPRTILKRQRKRLAALGYRSRMATELEFFVFREDFETLRDRGYRNMTRISAYNEDYHVFQTTREEVLMQAIRNGLHDAGIAVENTKGEADAGQAEINIRYADPLDMADSHVFAKNGIKEIAFLKGRALTFMAKWHHDAAGSSCHIHQSLVAEGGEPVFFDASAEAGMSSLMRYYLAGLLKYSDDQMVFLAPYVNSYKRFIADTFAPTKRVWSIDNRTAGYRISGADTPSVRIECRISGADLNPYLALAGQIAAGISGIEEGLPLEDPAVGDAYRAEGVRSIPGTLRAATRSLRDSAMLRQAMGDGVVDHYVRAAEWEQEEFDRKVTDYEVVRGFERA
ncbi:MAG: glutamine synthetase family protein [Paracoccaceae bacterium]|nr:glutamine synthetase family protein [Paracoccaceae bacterium]